MPTRTVKRPAKPVTARSLVKAIARVQDERGLEYAVLIGALCEVISGHQPTARKAVARIKALLDAGYAGAK